jgi:hypothetical protein
MSRSTAEPDDALCRRIRRPWLEADRQKLATSLVFSTYAGDARHVADLLSPDLEPWATVRTGLLQVFEAVCEVRPSVRERYEAERLTAGAA